MAYKGKQMKLQDILDKETTIWKGVQLIMQMQ